MLTAADVDAPDGETPRWLAWQLAGLAELAWRLLLLPGKPPTTRTAVVPGGGELTVVDRRAREELGYRPRVDIEGGLPRLAARHA